MDRLLITQLLSWKNQPKRKPLLLDGARQVGKSYLIEECFGKDHFRRVLKLDFLANPNLAGLFGANLNPQDILLNIELELGVDINPNNDLLFFDEIGECPAALSSLKFFAEQRPDLYLCASGSNVGLLNSFPVGKVEALELFPMSFEEFVMASGNEKILEAFRRGLQIQASHNKLWDLLLDYYFVGGMPEAVETWFADGGKFSGINERCSRIQNIHRSLLSGYLRDFGKYGGKVNAQHIERVFRNVPLQLSKNMDASVKRYRFSGVIERKRSYLDLSSPIEWLEKTKLVSRCYPIDCKPQSPLSAYRKDNLFKLFLFDIGVLGYMLDISYQEHRQQSYEYKGYLAENFVQNELIVAGCYPVYSWDFRQAGIEFLFKTNNGEIIPVEVKSGKRTRAKSLKTYIARYKPARTVKLIGSAGGTEQPGQNIAWPLYYAGRLKTL
ncbi:ATP-binding protein [Endozoicomonas sp. GU-1]|uniref:ATP-binding protein n=1 Tax=Endozoicomonas sp. GU-1 TaxID=3009078 RepID=UPI0022B39544|nr:ATP-binding protein [Endozoicomonas sp. GU-1]WBA83222.1 ATP-binding protein [Endozoicomonas sp. GU-1]WBA86147.1 ATP-binding protein [Endozoicomonas sp. GU-1]